MTKQPSPIAQDTSRVRLDKWLWAARFFKTRGLSSEEIDKGRIQVNGQPAKPGKEVRVGDRIDIRIGYVTRSVEVQALSGVRGPAPVAALLYRETAESVAARAAAAEQRRLAPEPALGLNQGRPSKKDRRSMERLRQPAVGQWNERWSASLDD
jgi:ribosome-associated heat shock protein Hsp15